jgi:predicted peptidase
MLTRCTLAALLALTGTSARAAAPKGTQTEKRSEKAGLNYLLYLPPGYEKADRPLPLILFLHGAGETGKNLSMVKKHGPPKLVEKKDFPFIVVSPQAPVRGWRPQALLTLLDEVSGMYKVDKDRVYLTGLSMGGFGTWALAATAPNRFAAIAPICGGGARTPQGREEMASKLKGMPIWVFHGGKDTAVPIKRSEEMIESLKKAGNEGVKFTVYPNAGHDSWTESYNNPKLYEWFLSHTRKGSK